MSDSEQTKTGISDQKSDIQELATFNPRNYFNWASYDFANTFYSAGILTLIAQSWFIIQGQKSGASFEDANLYFSIALAVSGVIMAVFIPLIGAASDILQTRKWFVVSLTLISLISISGWLLFDNIIAITILFVISSVTYQWSVMLYDAMLPSVAPPKRIGRLSSLAVAVGYTAGAVPFIYSFFRSQAGADPNSNVEVGTLTLGYFPELVVVVVVAFLLFGLPIIFVKERNWSEINETLIEETGKDAIDILHKRDEKSRPSPSSSQLVRSALVELYNTFVDIIRNNRGMLYFIVAYFIIADIANLIYIIAAEYMRISGLQDFEITLFLFVAGVGVVTVLYLLGIIMDRRGAKTGFMFIGFLWFVGIALFISYGTIFQGNLVLFIAAFFLGPAITGVWVGQRQMVLELVPNEEYIGQYLALAKFSGKLSSAIGPIIFGVSLIFFSNFYSTVGAYRASILLLASTLVLGFILFFTLVPDKFEEFSKRKDLILEAADVREFEHQDLLP